MKERILIFEDDMIASLVLEKILTSHGYHILGRFESADELTTLEREYQPDLILLDIMLSGEQSGLEAAELLREISDTPILFLSALSDQETRNKVESIENARLLNKPYVRREILEEMRSILERN